MMAFMRSNVSSAGRDRLEEAKDGNKRGVGQLLLVN